MRPTDLPWLERSPEDFRERLRSLREGVGDAKQTAQCLARYALTTNQLYLLGTAIANLSVPESGTTRLGVLCSGTPDLLLPAFVASCLRHGLWTQAVGAGFDQVAAQALDPDSSVNRASCHFVLLALDHRALSLAPTPGDPDRAEATVAAALRYVDSLRDCLHGASGCTVIVQTVPQVPDSLFGSLERALPGTQQWLIDHYNHALRRRIAQSGHLLLDAAALAEVVGLAAWHDPVQWAAGKFPCAHDVVPVYADWLARVVASARGRTHKCLVMDLDNTLWGGVIGDDGISGIVLGNGSPVGEAYLSTQHGALGLRQRGVLLAVSSKNDDSVARSVFRRHPEMALREDHITIFQANWQDKASNLLAIAQALDLGLDALVLLDDNAAERAQVRDALPAVAVPELPEDPALHYTALLAAGYFEAIAFTPEDRQRADQYRARAAARAALTNIVDIGSHLDSLQMRAVCTPFDEIGRARIAQLINKTNQFNLTTRRYTAAQVAEFERASDGLTVQVRLIDRFADHGIIAIIICIEHAADWLIDTWLMSCRVLNRTLEWAVLKHLVDRARAAGVRALIGQFIATERNGLVKDHYARLGFSPLHATSECSSWRLDVESYAPPPSPIELIDQVPASASAARALSDGDDESL